MSDTNINRLQVVKNSTLYVEPSFYTEQPEEDKPMTPEEEAKFMENIDMEALDKIIEEIEKTEDYPNEWIQFHEAMDEIRRDILNE